MKNRNYKIVLLKYMLWILCYFPIGALAQIGKGTTILGAEFNYANIQELHTEYATIKAQGAWGFTDRLFFGVFGELVLDLYNIFGDKLDYGLEFSPGLMARYYLKLPNKKKIGWWAEGFVQRHMGVDGVNDEHGYPPILVVEELYDQVYGLGGRLGGDFFLSQNAALTANITFDKRGTVEEMGAYFGVQIYLNRAENAPKKRKR